MAGTRRGFLTLIGAGVVSAAAILYVGLAGQGDWLALPGLGREKVKVSIASSVTKRAWLEAAAFQESDPQTTGGKAIKEGRLAPTVWSPGEGAWVQQLDKAGPDRSPLMAPPACPWC